MKKGKWLKWPLITVAAFAVADIAFKHFGGHDLAGQGMQQLQGGGFAHGGPGGGRGMGGHGSMHGFGGLNLLIEAGMLAGGWLTWKLSSSRLTKWIGAALMTVGAVSLLPKVLLLPAVLLVAYFMYKLSKNEKTSAYVPAAEFTGANTQAVDYLDNWEQGLHKEEK